MQPARHPEAPERKQSQQSEPPQLLSKMTNRKQDAGVTPSRGGSILQPFYSLSQMAFVRRQEARAWRPGPEWKVNRRELGWDVGRIVKTFDLLSHGSSVSGSRI